MHRMWGLVLFVCLSALVAGSARAGAFGSPLDSDACGSFDIVGDAMSDPNTAFINAASVKQCEALCGKGEKLCNAAVKDVASCYVGVYKNYETFGKLNCDRVYEGDAANRKLCKENTHASAQGITAKINAARQSSLADCATWGEVCATACNTPL
jgi:hypothetical protein